MPPAPQNTLGLPKNLKFYSPFPFGGMDLKASPLAIADQKFYYLENFLRLGDGYLRTAWDNGAPIYTAVNGLSIVSFFFYTIGSAYYAAVFLSDGSAIQVTLSNGAETQIGPAGTFFSSSSGYIPACTQWGTLYLLISNRNTQNDFWAWDGSLLYRAGSAAPTGPNNPVITSGGATYSTPPTVTPFGGAGTGLAVTAAVQGGSVVQLQITNPGTGYDPGDIVQLAFSGGGTDSSAILQSSLVANGSVTALNFIYPGLGYGSPPTVTIDAPTSGVTATATVTISGGAVNGYTITNAGSGYTSPPTVSFSGGSPTTAAIAAAIVTANEGGAGVSAISVVARGVNYTSGPTVSFVGGGGSGATATATVSGGQVISIAVTSGGSGYASPPAVVLTGGGGTGAQAVAYFAPTGVQAVAVVNPGSGFTSVPTITFEGGQGAGATGLVVLEPTTVAQINLTSTGSGYTSAPAITFVGGGNGSGATATAHLDGDVVGYITLTNAGSGYTGPIQVVFTGGGGSGAGAQVLYAPTGIASVIVSSTGSGYVTPPAVVVSSGANNSAYATVSLMPYGVSGSSMETFNSRLWIANPALAPFSVIPPGGNFSFSATGNFIDFATPDGGGIFINSDRFLQIAYFNIRQSNGYLYFFGDGSVSVVSNVQTSGTPSLTTFTYQNVDPQVGLSWRDTIQDFGRAVIAVNTTGVYGLYGGNVTKISDDLDRLFVNAIFPPAAGAVTPSGAVATLFNVKHYLSLMTITDPDTGLPRNVMVTWNEKDWVLTSQSVGLTYIGTQKVSSTLYAWGTDGTSLYPLFNKPSTILTKRFDTKLYGADSQHLLKDLVSIHMVAQDQSPGRVGIAGDMSYVVSVGTLPIDLTGSAASFALPASTVAAGEQVNVGVLAFQAPPPFWPIWTSGTGGQAFNTIGVRFSTTSPDFVLGNFMLGYVPVVFTT